MNLFMETGVEKEMPVQGLPKITYFKSEKISSFDNEIMNAYENIVYNFIHGKHSLCVRGAAGTGKTTLIKEIIQGLYRYKIYLCAPTHKAVSQFGKIEDLLTKGQLSLNKIEIGTLQKGLGLKMDIDEQGDYIYEITGQGELHKNSYDYVIIDEASMVSYEQYYALKDLNIPLLFIGDPNQLPAVTKEKQEFSVFQFFPNTHTVYLSEKKRYACKRLKELTDVIEKAIEKNDVPYEDFLLNTMLNFSDIVRGTKGMKEEEISQMYYIDYTNKGGQFRWLSLKRHYYIEGETYYSKDIENRQINKRDKYLLLEMKDDFITVADKKIKYKICKFRNVSTEKEIQIYCYNPNEEEFFKEAKKSIRKWKKSLNLPVGIDLFTEVSNEDKTVFVSAPYPIKEMGIITKAVMLYPEKVYTIHASQGSTFDKVLVNIGSIHYAKGSGEQLNKEKLKLLYVAVSRAREKVYII